MKIILFCLAVSMVFTSIQAQSPDEDTQKLIEVWLDAQKDYEKLPGISAIAVRDQEVVWKGAAGMANPGKNIPTSPSTLGSICSISKLFTSVAIMQLYDAGKVRLDDRIEDLLPWYNLEQKYPDSGPVTIRSLLTHSSGLPREANYPYWTGPDYPFPSSEAVRSGLQEQETLYPASTYFQYSNLGLTLLGEVVEEVSGMPYEEYVAANILTPLGLTNTRTTLPEDKYGQQLAIGYSAINRKGEREKVNLFQAEGIMAAAGYSSNVEDLGRFASWQLRLLDTTTSEILKPATLRNMHNVHWVDPDWNLYWGLGFAVDKGDDGSKWVGHGGSCPGYRSSLLINPSSEMAYAVIINASGTNPAKYVNGLHKILQKAENMSEDSTSVDLSEFTGYYDTMPWGSEMYLGRLKGKLVTLYLPADNPVESMTFYEHVEGDTFRRIRDDGEPGDEIIFDRGENGKISRVWMHNNYRNKVR